MKRHEYVVHYATQNPFEQFVYRVRLNASEHRKLEREFIRGLRDWTVHSYRIEEADLPTVSLSTLLEELDDLRTGSK
jgi:hypothetical protein